MAPRSYVSRLIVATMFCVISCLTFLGAAPGQRRPGSESAESAESTVTLGGWIHADYGEGVPSDLTVRLDTNKGMIGGEQTANASGYFEFVGLPKIYYRLTVTARGFQAYERDLDLRSVGDKLVVNVQLSPAPKTKAPAPDTSTSFTDDNAPKNARNEYRRGQMALRSGNPSEAQTHFEKSVQEYPCYARAQTDLAVVLSDKQQYPASETALKKALECDPDYLDAYTELGQLYYNEKQYQDSAAILQQGLRRSPASWQFYYQLGEDDYHLGRYAKAEQEYLKAESLSASIPADIHVKLADVYLKQSAYDKAYAEMQAYVLAEPGGRLTPKLKGVMRRMESDHILTAAHPGTILSSPPQP